MKKFKEIFCSVAISATLVGTHLAHAQGELTAADYALSEVRSVDASHGKSYETVLQENIKEGWLHYNDSLAEVHRSEPVKAHALARFNGTFMPNLGSDQVGYLDTNNQFRIYEVRDSQGNVLDPSKLNLPSAKNVIVVPVAYEKATQEMYINLHYHLEPDTAWGFKQEFYSFPGGRVDEGFTAINAMLSELYEESGFQSPKSLKIVGFRYDDSIKSIYFYVLINKETIQNIEKNSNLPEVKQFFPFDYSFIPADRRAEYDSALKKLDKADPNFKKLADKLKKEFRVKALFPRQRGDFDSNGVFWSKVNLNVQPGERFVEFSDDGRFGSFKNPEVLKDLQVIKNHL